MIYAKKERNKFNVAVDGKHNSPILGTTVWPLIKSVSFGYTLQTYYLENDSKSDASITPSVLS